MNTPHKWAKEICHFAQFGIGSVETLLICVPEDKSQQWTPLRRLALFESQDYEFRIKIERVYPATSLTMQDLDVVYKGETFGDALVSVANAAIKRYIIDTEE